MEMEKKIYTEVYLSLLKEGKDAIDKIPDELKKIIIEKADTSYPYKIEKILPESKEILESIINTYIKE